MGRGAPEVPPGLTVDQLALLAGTTTRNIRALQTLGLIPGPRIVARTGFYGEEHRRRLAAVMRLQENGFSLGSIGILLRAWESGSTLEDVVGLGSPSGSGARSRSGATAAADGAWEDDDYEGWPPPGRGRLLSLVPTTVIDQPAAS